MSFPFLNLVHCIHREWITVTAQTKCSCKLQFSIFIIRIVHLIIAELFLGSDSVYTKLLPLTLKPCFWSVSVVWTPPLQICQNLFMRGLSLVGWYHSHPRGPALPSLQDIDSQMDHQLRLQGSNNGFQPCLGIICGTAFINIVGRCVDVID